MGEASSAPNITISCISCGMPPPFHNNWCTTLDAGYRRLAEDRAAGTESGNPWLTKIDQLSSDLAAALSALAEVEAELANTERRAVTEFRIATGYMNERDSLASALAEIRRLCDEADESAGSFLGIRVNNSRIDTSAIRAALPEETE